MLIEQAVYGESKGGHGLRWASGDPAFAAELASRLDLPDTAPGGAVWSPALCGFPYNDSYILARTFADTTASRAGMVLSHAVIVSLDEIAVLSDLRPLLANLMTSIADIPAPTVRDVEIAENEPPSAPELIVAAQALTTRGSGPVVKVGIDGFEQLVVALWFRLWPELRCKFSFRLSFGPHDIFENPEPALVCTPSALAGRWAGYRLVGAPSSGKSATGAAAMLSGETYSAPVLDFARSIEAPLDRLTDLPLVERAYAISATTNPTFEASVSALRLVERLSPNPGRGVAGKNELVARLLAKMPEASARDVLLLRNLGTTGFPSSTLLWKGVQDWVLTAPPRQGDDDGMLALLEIAMDASMALESWRGAVFAGLEEAFSSSPFFSSAFWRWAELRPDLVTSLIMRIGRGQDLEKRLAAAAPDRMTEQAGSAILSVAKSLGWFVVHGVAASAFLDPREALRRQLEVDVKVTDLDGFRSALRHVSPSNVLSLAVEQADPASVEIAAEGVAANPQLLASIDFTMVSAQQVWARAMALNPEAWRGPEDPHRAFATIVDRLLDGAEVNLDLVSVLSTSPVANLASYPRRSEIWDRVPREASQRLLHATAEGWLARARTDAAIDAPDSVLQTSITSSTSLETTLRFLAAENINAALQVVAKLTNLDERRVWGFIAGWLGDSTLLLQADAEAIGQFLLSRRYQQALNELVVMVRNGREDLKPALRICRPMLGPLARLSLGVSSLDHEDRWLVLKALAIELYPSGPDQHELWSRAGGKGSDLKSYGSGESRWQSAILEIQRGKGPPIAKLLEEMRNEYPKNECLRQLSSLPDFGPTRGGLMSWLFGHD